MEKPGRSMSQKSFARGTKSREAAPHKRLQRIGISVSLIDSLPLAELSPGR